MATSNTANSLVRDLVQDVAANEPLARRKANTVTAAIGTIVTTILAVGTLLVQSDLNLPEWVTFVVMVAGMVATDLGISKTKNGVTESTANRLELELARRIDLHHASHEPLKQDEPKMTDPHTLRVEADRLQVAIPDFPSV